MHPPAWPLSIFLRAPCSALSTTVVPGNVLTSWGTGHRSSWFCAARRSLGCGHTQPAQDLWTAVPTTRQHFWSREETLLWPRLVLTWACWGWSSQVPSVSEEGKVLLSRCLTFSHYKLPPRAVSLAKGHRLNLINFAFLFPVVLSSEACSAEAGPRSTPAASEALCWASPVLWVCAWRSCLPQLPSSSSHDQCIKKTKVPLSGAGLETSNRPLKFPSFQILTEITGYFFSPLPTPLTALCQNYSALWSITRYTI